MAFPYQVNTEAEFLKDPLAVVQKALAFEFVLLRCDSVVQKFRSHQLRAALFRVLLGTETPDLMLNENGKPSVPGLGLWFSTSHSGEYWIFAFRRDKEIGVDLEVWQKAERLERIALRHFLDAENESWEKLEAEEAKTQQLLTLWTKKEAWIKAKGSNLFREISQKNVLNLKSPDALTVVNEKNFVFSLVCL